MFLRKYYNDPRFLRTVYLLKKQKKNFVLYKIRYMIENLLTCYCLLIDSFKYTNKRKVRRMCSADNSTVYTHTVYIQQNKNLQHQHL